MSKVKKPTPAQLHDIAYNESLKIPLDEVHMLLTDNLVKRHKVMEEVTHEGVTRVINGLGETFSSDFGFGAQAKVSSQRTLLFKDNITCVCCGIKGAFYRKTASFVNGNLSYHVNLYGSYPTGEEVLFTKDHIVPKSLGGKDKLTNFVTACSTCNSIKQNSTSSWADIKKDLSLLDVDDIMAKYQPGTTKEHVVLAKQMLIKEENDAK